MLCLSDEDQRLVIKFCDSVKADILSGGYKRNETVTKEFDREYAFLQSFGAEVVFCCMMGIDPDFQVHKKSHCVDCVYNGLRIDVKWTKYNNGKLIVYQKLKDAEVDCYVLITGEFPNYDYKGYAFKKDVVRPENLKELNPKYPKAYCFDQKNLRLAF